MYLHFSVRAYRSPTPTTSSPFFLQLPALSKPKHSFAKIVRKTTDGEFVLVFQLWVIFSSLTQFVFTFTLLLCAITVCVELQKWLEVVSFQKLTLAVTGMKGYEFVLLCRVLSLTWRINFCKILYFSVQASLGGHTKVPLKCQKFSNEWNNREKKSNAKLLLLLWKTELWNTQLCKL